MERVGRVFAAVPLPGEERAILASRFDDVPLPGKVVPPHNWHLTLRFLGQVGSVTFERFLLGLEPLEGTGGFTIRLGRLGGFPDPRRATVVWAGVEEGADRLVELNQAAEEAARAAGLDPEERPYHPHLTLARVRPPEDMGDLVELDLGLRWSCREVVVYRSHLGPGGARYEPLELLELAR